MKELVATYITKTGIVALNIYKFTSFNNSVTYSYIGKHGAGSGHSLEDMKMEVKSLITTRRGITLAYGTDFM